MKPCRPFRAAATLCLGLAAALAVPGIGGAQAAPARPAPEPAPIRAGRASPPGTYGDLDVLHYDVVVGLPGPGGNVVDGAASLTLRPARAGLSLTMPLAGHPGG